jgi:hypothetical protein
MIQRIIKQRHKPTQRRIVPEQLFKFEEFLEVEKLQLVEVEREHQ